MALVSGTLPTLGGPRGDGEAAVRNLLSAILTEVNGDLEVANLKGGGLDAVKLRGITEVLGSSPAVAYIGDIDGAKWLVGFASFKFVFYSDSADTGAIAGIPNLTYAGRTYRAKAALGPDGTILTAVPTEYKTLLTGGAAAMQFTSSGNFSLGGSATLSGGNVFYLDPADFAAGSRTTKYRLRVLVAPNQVAPAITITVSLNPVTLASPGASGNANSYAFGAAVSGSSVAFASPSASTLAQGNSGDFTPPAAGYYAIAVAASGAAPGGSRVDVSVSLQMRQV